MRGVELFNRLEDQICRPLALYAKKNCPIPQKREGLNLHSLHTTFPAMNTVVEEVS